MNLKKAFVGYLIFLSLFIISGGFVLMDALDFFGHHDRPYEIFPILLTPLFFFVVAIIGNFLLLKSEEESADQANAKVMVLILWAVPVLLSVGWVILSLVNMLSSKGSVFYYLFDLFPLVGAGLLVLFAIATWFFSHQWSKAKKVWYWILNYILTVVVSFILLVFSFAVSMDSAIS